MNERERATQLIQEYNEKRAKVLEALPEDQRKELKSIDAVLNQIHKQTPGPVVDDGKSVLLESTEEEKVAEAFQQLSPGERTALMQEHPEEWKRGWKAIETVGMRHLLRGF